MANPKDKLYRIDLVVDKLMYGGAERFFYEVFSRLTNKAFKVRIIALGEASDYYRGLFQQLDIETVALRVKRFNPLVVIKLYHLIREPETKIVHTAMLKSPILVSFLSFILHSKKFILHDQTGIDLDQFPHYFGFKSNLGGFVGRCYTILMGNIARFMDGIITFTKRDYDYYFKYKPGKVFLIPNSIDPSNFSSLKPNLRLKKALGIPKENKIITMIARLAPEKNWPVFLNTARESLKACQKLDFLIVGDGTLRDEIVNTVEKYGLKPRIHLLGFRTDIPDILSITDIFMLTSVAEPFGVSVLEAMASGIPVITNVFGGPREFVADGVDGFLAQKNEPQEYVEKIRLLLGDEALSKRVGENARKKVRQKYTVDEAAKKLEGIYQQLIK